MCVRAVCSVVMEKVVYETFDTPPTTIFSDASPSDIIYVVSAIYFVRLCIFENSPKRMKETQLHQMVLTEKVYKLINAILFIMLVMMKNPLNAI